MFEQELDNLLQKNWSDEERRLISLLMDNVIYYKKLIPKSLKQDIMNALQMCNVLKTELEIYRAKCNCLESKNVSTPDETEQECEQECKCKCEQECKCKCEQECKCKCEQECKCKCEQECEQECKCKCEMQM
jgi:hypothetical protein